jgi:uncharacterized protein (DUF2249 family)
MQAVLDEIPEANRVDALVAMLAKLPRGEVLTVTCADDPTELGARVVERADGRFDRQAVHVARKKSAGWQLHFKRQGRL